MISLFVRVIGEPVIDEILFLIFLSIKLSPAFTKISLSIFLAPIVFDSIELINGTISLLNITSDGRQNVNPPDCILDNRVLKILY